jgi:hypothetical protein
MLALMLTLTLAACPSELQAEPDNTCAGWKPVGSPGPTHTSAAAAQLQDGRVLVCGGYKGELEGTSEVLLFEPEKLKWAKAPPMTAPRLWHTATLLKDGRVLVVGGGSAYKKPLASVELFDPKKQQWSAGAPRPTPRYNHLAVRLPNGEVLVMGGENGDAPTTAVEIYDPVRDRWRSVQPLPSDDLPLFTAALRDGPKPQVLLLAELNRKLVMLAFDIVSQTWTQAALPEGPRAFAPVVVLADGTLLYTGGKTNMGSPSFPLTSEVLRPAAGEWKKLHVPLPRILIHHSATLLPDGKVLLAGGSTETRQSGKPGGKQYTVIDPTTSVLLLDPSTGATRETAPLPKPSEDHFAFPLKNGQVLVFGGGFLREGHGFVYQRLPAK